MTSRDDENDDYRPPVAVSEDDQDLLKEIRDTYSYFDDRWREIREERNTDMRYIAGDPWTPEDRRARKDAGRPCINHDELGQYVNACVNGVRQNKRGIKIDPRGGTASNKKAEVRQNLVRAIEYRCGATSTYLTAFQAMVEGSYGFFRIGREYVSNDVESDSPDIFNQRITISAIDNPNSILYDPDCKKPDWSDATRAFELNPMPREEFKRRFPHAQITDFTPEHMNLAKDWIQDRIVLAAAYWKLRVIETRWKYQLENLRVVDRLEKGQRALNKRKVEKKELWQYETNGVEILSREMQPGVHIPIIPMIGLQRYIDEGGVSKRKIFSLPRLARDPQMSLAYLNSLEMEEAGLTPKTPYMGYKGQFDSAAEAWENVTKIPVAFLEVDPMPDGANGTILPLPRREPFSPNFQQYEIAKDSCRRAIQAAMGITPLPTAAQRANQKSGIALEKVREQEEIGSYHFVDSYERAVSFAGRVIDSWIPVTYDTERTETLRKPDDSHQMAVLNTEQPYPDPETGEMVHYPIDEDDDHDVTVSTGPSVASQQQAASDTLDLMITNLAAMPLAPPQAQKLLALAIQMKQLGPKGDEMAEIISPTNAGEAQQAAQQMAAAHQQLAQQGQVIAAMQGELQKLQLEKQGKVIDNEYKMALEKMRMEVDLAKAEVATRAQQLSERIEFVTDLAHKFLEQGHDVGMLAAQQAHERQQTDAAAQQAQIQQQQQEAAPPEQA